MVDILATMFCFFGWFVDGKQTSFVTILRVWIYSFGVFCVMAGVYYLLQDNVLFDRICNFGSNDTDLKAGDCVSENNGSEQYSMTMQIVDK